MRRRKSQQPKTKNRVNPKARRIKTKLSVYRKMRGNFLKKKSKTKQNRPKTGKLGQASIPVVVSVLLMVTRTIQASPPQFSYQYQKTQPSMPASFTNAYESIFWKQKSALLIRNWRRLYFVKFDNSEAPNYLIPSADHLQMSNILIIPNTDRVIVAFPTEKVLQLELTNSGSGSSWRQEDLALGGGVTYDTLEFTSDTDNQYIFGGGVDGKYGVIDTTKRGSGVSTHVMTGVAVDNSPDHNAVFRELDLMLLSSMRKTIWKVNYKDYTEEGSHVFPTRVEFHSLERVPGTSKALIVSGSDGLYIAEVGVFNALTITEHRSLAGGVAFEAGLAYDQETILVFDSSGRSVFMNLKLEDIVESRVGDFTASRHPVSSVDGRRGSYMDKDTGRVYHGWMSDGVPRAQNFSCFSECGSCLGPEETNCKSCPPGHSLTPETGAPATPPGGVVRGRCAKNCLDGFYQYQFYECRSCVEGCKDCQDGVSCETCVSDWTMVASNKTCVYCWERTDHSECVDYRLSYSLKEYKIETGGDYVDLVIEFKGFSRIINALESGFGRVDWGQTFKLVDLGEPNQGCQDVSYSGGLEGVAGSGGSSGQSIFYLTVRIARCPLETQHSIKVLKKLSILTQGDKSLVSLGEEIIITDKLEEMRFQVPPTLKLNHNSLPAENDPNLPTSSHNHPNSSKNSTKEAKPKNHQITKQAIRLAWMISLYTVASCVPRVGGILANFLQIIDLITSLRLIEVQFDPRVKTFFSLLLDYFSAPKISLFQKNFHLEQKSVRMNTHNTARISAEYNQKMAFENYGLSCLVYITAIAALQLVSRVPCLREVRWLRAGVFRLRMFMFSYAFFEVYMNILLDYSRARWVLWGSRRVVTKVLFLVSLVVVLAEFYCLTQIFYDLGEMGKGEIGGEKFLVRSGIRWKRGRRKDSTQFFHHNLKRKQKNLKNQDFEKNHQKLENKEKKGDLRDENSIIKTRTIQRRPRFIRNRTQNPQKFFRKMRFSRDKTNKQTTNRANSLTNRVSNRTKTFTNNSNGRKINNFDQEHNLMDSDRLDLISESTRRRHRPSRLLDYLGQGRETKPVALPPRRTSNRDKFFGQGIKKKRSFRDSKTGRRLKNNFEMDSGPKDFKTPKNNFQAKNRKKVKKVHSQGSKVTQPGPLDDIWIEYIKHNLEVGTSPQKHPKRPISSRTTQGGQKIGIFKYFHLINILRCVLIQTIVITAQRRISLTTWAVFGVQLSFFLYTITGVLLFKIIKSKVTKFSYLAQETSLTAFIVLFFVLSDWLPSNPTKAYLGIAVISVALFTDLVSLLYEFISRFSLFR